VIPLPSGALPAEPARLADELARGLSELFELPAGQDAVRCVYPPGAGPGELEELRIDLDGAEVRESSFARFQGLDRQDAVVLRVLLLKARGAPIRWRGACSTFELTASQVAFALADDRSGGATLVPVDLSDGLLAIRIATADLERVLLEAAGEWGRPHGVRVERVELELAQAGQRQVRALARIKVRKLLPVNVKLEALLTLDEQLNATLTGVSARAEGLLGKAIDPELSRRAGQLEGRSWPLAALPLGDLRVRSLEVRVQDGLELRAALG